MSFASRSPALARARDQRFLNEVLSRDVSMLQRISALAGPRIDTRTAEQRWRDHLDAQHDQVRDAFAVLRGEMQATDGLE